MGSHFQKEECFLYNFSTARKGEGTERPGTQFFRQFEPIYFGTLPKKSAEKSYKSKKQTKNGAKRLYFNIFVNFLQYFDHFIVEIFPGLDYNRTRKSKEGPKC